MSGHQPSQATQEAGLAEVGKHLGEFVKIALTRWRELRSGTIQNARSQTKAWEKSKETSEKPISKKQSTHAGQNPLNP